MKKTILRRRINNYLFFSFLIIEGLLVQSCTLRKEKMPAIRTAEAYRGSLPDTASIARIPYQKFFEDTILCELISEGMAHNVDLQVAINKLSRARIDGGVAKYAILPDVQLNADQTYNKYPRAAEENLSSRSQEAPWETFVSSTWEADVWGKLRSTARKAYLDVLRSEAGVQLVKTGLVAAIAEYYYTLQALDEQLRITDQRYQVRRDDVSTMKDLFKSNAVTAADIRQSEANALEAEFLMIETKKQIWEIENKLSLLLGRDGGKIGRSAWKDEAADSDYDNVGVPIDLLSNRPDVKQSLLALEGTMELKHIARTQFLPQLKITADVGYTGDHIASLFNPTGFFVNLLGGLTQPLWSKGRNRARYQQAEIDRQNALLEVQKILKEAGNDVSNALYAKKIAREKNEVCRQRMTSLKDAVAYTKELLTYSENNYINVLAAEQSFLEAQLSLVEAGLEVKKSSISLYRSLGGGWSVH